MQTYFNGVFNQALRARMTPTIAVALLALLLPAFPATRNARNQASLQVHRTAAMPGEMIAVTYSGFTPVNKSAWIGFYKHAAAPDDYIHYTFLNNLNDNTYDVEAPREHGAYNFRIFADETYNPLALSATITIGPPQRQVIPGAGNIQDAGKSSTGKKSTPSSQDETTIHYDGKAEADGRSARLELTFKDNRVSGRLQAKGVNAPNIRLPSTEIEFGEASFSGIWESPEARIDASWQGGDYADGKLVPGYPTTGQLRISLETRNGEEVVFLHRIATSRYGYVFPLQGEVYDSGDAAPTNPSNAQTGKGNPVGEWTSQVELRTTQMAEQEKITLNYTMVIKPSGSVDITIFSLQTGGRMESEETITVEAQWRHTNTGISISKWKAAPNTLWEVNHDDDAPASFKDPNTLVFESQKDSGDKKGVSLMGTSEKSMVFRRKSKKTESSTDVATDKDVTPDKDVVPDKDEILSIELAPDIFKMMPEGRRELPDVIAVTKKSFDRASLAIDDVEWTIEKGGSVEGKEIVLGKAVSPGDKLTLTATLKDAPEPIKAQSVIQVVSEIKTGSITSVVAIVYEGVAREHAEERRTIWPKRPLSATMELRSSFAPEKTLQRKTFPPGSEVVFKNVEPGQYDIWITKIDLPELPHGYVPQKELPVKCVGWVAMPDNRNPDSYNRSFGAQFPVHIPRHDKDQGKSGFVYGRILYKGATVSTAKINVTMPPDFKRIYTSNISGEYSIDTTELKPGKYRITVERYGNPRTAGPGDHLDVASAKNQKPITFSVPLTDFNGLQLDIDVLKRSEIFGGPAGREEPVVLP